MIQELSGTEKATLLLSILGPQKAARILRHLPDDMANLLSARVATLPPPDPEVVNSIYAEISKKAIESSPIQAIESSVEEIKNEDVQVDDSDDDDLLDDLADEILTDDDIAVDNNESEIDSEADGHGESPIRLIPTKNIVKVLKNEKPRARNLFLMSIEDKKSDDVRTVLEIETGSDILGYQLIETPLLKEVQEIVVREVIKKAEVL